MARPKRGNYATGPEGAERYKKALREYLKKTKKPEVKKPVAKKPVAKKPATKKPAAKKPVAKKPPVKKPVAKKPAPKKTATNLKIKKAANTTRQALKKATPVVKKAAKTVAKKADEAKKTVTKKAGQLRQAIKKGRAPAPKTPQQKAVSKAYRGTKKLVGDSIKKRGKDALKIAKKAIKNPKSAIKGGIGGALTALAGHVINTRVDRAFAKRKGMTLQEFNAAKKKMKDNRNIVRSAKNIVNKVRGKSGESSTTKNINKQKKANTTPNRGLKIKKTERSSRKNTNKDYNAPTATKTADKRFSTFRVNADENLKLQKERQSGNTETYSRKLSKKAEDTKTKSTKTSGKKMHAIEKRNRERFGHAHVDRLKAKHDEWKKRRKKK